MIAIPFEVDLSSAKSPETLFFIAMIDFPKVGGNSGGELRIPE